MLRGSAVAAEESRHGYKWCGFGVTGLARDHCVRERGSRLFRAVEERHQKQSIAGAAGGAPGGRVHHVVSNSAVGHGLVDPSDPGH